MREDEEVPLCYTINKRRNRFGYKESRRRSIGLTKPIKTREEEEVSLFNTVKKKLYRLSETDYEDYEKKRYRFNKIEYEKKKKRRKEWNESAQEKRKWHFELKTGKPTEIGKRNRKRK